MSFNAPSSVRSQFWWITSTLSHDFSCRFFSRWAIFLSDRSIEVIFLTFLERGTVTVPGPGPISSTSKDGSRKPEKISAVFLPYSYSPSLILFEKSAVDFVFASGSKHSLGPLILSLKMACLASLQLILYFSVRLFPIMTAYSPLSEEINVNYSTSFFCIC